MRQGINKAAKPGFPLSKPTDHVRNLSKEREMRKFMSKTFENVSKDQIKSKPFFPLYIFYFCYVENLVQIPVHFRLDI